MDSLYPRQELEAYLKKHPANEEKRERLLKVYSRDNKPSLDRLKYHTFEMIKYHPGNDRIAFSNIAAFYMDQQYARDVVSRLEEQVSHGHANRKVYWLIAYIAKHVALPVDFSGAGNKQDFLRYYGLPKDTAFISEPDKSLVDKSIHYYQLAIDASKGDSFYASFYTQQLGELLEKLNRFDEAIAAYEGIRPTIDDIVKPTFLVDYGSCLRKAGRIPEAKSILKQVRPCDHEGFGQGPAHDTTRAENLLGEIALDEGNTKQACDYLLSSCNVQKCCHNTTIGLPKTLARKLLEKGQYDCVIKYCRTAISKFAGGIEIKSILQRAVDGKKSRGKVTG
jgi:tetratricopeptide (TPR) repeat protein